MSFPVSSRNYWTFQHHRRKTLCQLKGAMLLRFLTVNWVLKSLQKQKNRKGSSTIIVFFSTTASEWMALFWTLLYGNKQETFACIILIAKGFQYSGHWRWWEAKGKNPSLSLSRSLSPHLSLRIYNDALLIKPICSVERGNQVPLKKGTERKVASLFCVCSTEIFLVRN